MKLFSLSIFLLLPLVSQAASYEVAHCAYLARPDKTGWDERYSTPGPSPVELNQGENRRYGVVNTGSDGICTYVTGTNSASTLSVSLVASSGANLKPNPDCTFSGQGVSQSTVTKVITVDDYAFIDHLFSNGDLERDVLYLAKPGSSAEPNWYESACEALAKRLTAMSRVPLGFDVRSPSFYAVFT